MFNNKNNNIIILILILIFCFLYCIYEINNLKKNQCNNVENFTTIDAGLITTPAAHTINCKGHQHISTISGPLWLLPKENVIISKAWGGTGNLSVEGTITSNKIMITNEITRKYQVAGYYQIKAYGRGMELHYGWNMLWDGIHDGNSHLIASRLNVFEYTTTNRKGCVKYGTVLYNSNGFQGDNNWYPRKLIIFQGYCVRFFYWNVDSDSNDIFKTGEHQVYDWSVTLKKTYTQQVHLIFVSLIEEEDKDYIKLIDAAQVTCERLVNYDWQKDLFPITMPGHTQTFNNTV